MSGSPFYCLCSLYPHPFWLGTVSEGKNQNIAAELCIRAHFQPMCQIGEKGLVWNLEQAEMTSVMLQREEKEAQEGEDGE